MSAANDQGAGPLTPLDPNAAHAAHAHEPYAPVFVGARRAELDTLLTRYPTKMAALLPALWMIQEDRGWVSAVAVLLLLAAAAGFIAPRLLAWPLALVLTWVAVAALIRLRIRPPDD